MNEPIYMDAEYESIRTVMKNRGHDGGQLPGKTLTFSPTDRAKRVEALDLRLQQLRKVMPFIGTAAVAVGGLLVGMML